MARAARPTARAAATGSGAPAPEDDGPFAYTIDLKFGKRDATKTHHNVEKLDAAADATNPLIVFMGVNTEATRPSS